MALVTGDAEPHRVAGRQVAEQIGFHGLSGSAARAIEGGTLDASPQMQRQIRSNWIDEQRKSALVDLECRRIGQALTAWDGPALSQPILIKGEAVARRYRDPPVRNYTDMDLLVDESQAAVWGILVRRLGFLPENAWRERTERQFLHHAAYRRRLEDRHITCEIHTRLMTHRKTLHIGYGALAPHTQPGPAEGILQLTLPAQLVALALHLAHHEPGRRRLIWYRDFLELATPADLQAAAALAEDNSIGWLFHWTMAEVAKTSGAQMGDWDGSHPHTRLLDEPQLPLLEHFAIARQWGLSKGSSYLISKLDPRRFIDNQGGFQWGEVWAWLVRMVASLVALLRRKASKRS